MEVHLLDEWDDEWVKRLIELYNEGKTYTEIGREIGRMSGNRRTFTRSSVSGKVNRLISKGLLHRRAQYYLKGHFVNLDQSRLKPRKDPTEPKRGYVVKSERIRVKTKKVEAAEVEDEIETVNEESKSRSKPWSPTFYGTPHGKSLPGLRYPNRPETEKSVTLIHLKYRRCRSPVGDLVGADQLFCNAPTEDESPYCNQCKTFLYRPFEKREKESDLIRRYVPKGER